MKKFKAGDVVPETGFYRIINASGMTLKSVTLCKGQRFPPTNDENYRYVSDA